MVLLLTKQDAMEKIRSFPDFKPQGLVQRKQVLSAKPVRDNAFKQIDEPRRDEPKLYEFRVYNRAVPDNIIFIR